MSLGPACPQCGGRPANIPVYAPFKRGEKTVFRKFTRFCQPCVTGGVLREKKERARERARSLPPLTTEEENSPASGEPLQKAGSV